MTDVAGPNHLLRIDALYCFVSKDADGNEGVCAFHSAATGGWIPMVGADVERIDSLKAIARDMARASGRTITLCRFGTREELEVIGP